MTGHNTVNVKDGSKLDAEIEELLENSEMLETYSGAGRYLMREGLQKGESDE